MENSRFLEKVSAHASSMCSVFPADERELALTCNQPAHAINDASCSHVEVRVIDSTYLFTCSNPGFLR